MHNHFHSFLLFANILSTSLLLKYTPFVNLHHLKSLILILLSVPLSPAGLLIVTCFGQRWVLGDFWLWVYILWNILVGTLWGPTWNSSPQWGFVFPFPSALWSLSTWVHIKEESLTVVCLVYNPSWMLTWG